MPILFKDIESADAGARFFNADLHIHSFGGSHDVKDASMTAAAIIDAAVAGDIGLIAITDHNSDMNTKASIDYAEKYKGKLLVLPGVEITTGNGHLLAYFSPTDFANVGKLLAKISLVGDAGDQNCHTSMSMADVIGQVESLRGVCIAAHVDRDKTGFETIAVGYPHWKRDIIMSPGLYALEHDDVATLSWYSDDDDSTPQGIERRKIAATRSDLPTTVGRPLLAHVQGSDAHTLKDFKAGRAGKLLTRFKMDELSFEGFRTALADPEARVRATATIPVSLPRILGMHVTGGFLDGECMRFSDNLTCIIGGRGTGKSSALKALAYGLGIDDDIEGTDNCPGTIIVYGEDGSGVRYRYERVEGSKPMVRAKEDGEIIDVPRDAFRVEYYKQGELAEVAKDPLKNPSLLQKFLDRHLLLDDLLGKEEQLIRTLEQNSAQLIPLEGSANQLTAKKTTLKEINTKLTIAEEGHLKEIVADKKKLSNEVALAASLEQIRRDYDLGLDLKILIRDFDECEVEASPLTDLIDSKTALAKIKAVIEGSNEFLEQQEKVINSRLNVDGKKILVALTELKVSQKQLETQINSKITVLQQKGLTGNLAELTTLLSKKSALTQEVTKINGQSAQLKQLRADRKRYLSELDTTRQEIASRRKAQLGSINTNLGSTIKDYTVYLHYDPNGITEEFKDYILDKMHGTYFQQETAEKFCASITPPDLAKLVLAQDYARLASRGGISLEWATDLSKKLYFFKSLHELEVMWKPPCPLITAKTKNEKPKEIPVNQLSDGQKHTIMLTIAMLAESNIPLIIDQPEDDLDNAFIFSAVVRVLRTIKERRQVILVTHNANIAVLGDAELLLPMQRKGEGGGAFDRGSIDQTETKKVVLKILEGGRIAFERRKEIYGH